jgi:hypothetical protein
MELGIESYQKRLRSAYNLKHNPFAVSFSWLGLRAKRPPQGGLFTLGTKLTRTTIYIDGYNLYYSRLKGTPHKWLDIVALFRDRIKISLGSLSPIEYRSSLGFTA